jgi:ABC-type protease/lipase transport system fused ATPase/permease subunit
MPNFDSNDPVTLGLRASARQLAGVAVFSGVVNLLTLSGSLYMLQVYDRGIPSRNVATLVGLSLIVLVAYLLQGYFVFVLVTSRAALISSLRTTNTPLPREEGSAATLIALRRLRGASELRVLKGRCAPTMTTGLSLLTVRFKK